MGKSIVVFKLENVQIIGQYMTSQGKQKPEIPQWVERKALIQRT